MMKNEKRYTAAAIVAFAIAFHLTTKVFMFAAFSFTALVVFLSIYLSLTVLLWSVLDLLPYATKALVKRLWR